MSMSKNEIHILICLSSVEVLHNVMISIIKL